MKAAKTSSKQKLNTENDSKEKESEVDDSVTPINSENIMKCASKILNLTLRDLFQNKQIDEELINHIVKMCFDFLEVPNEVKNISVKERAFEILKIVVTRYNTHSSTSSNLMQIKLTNKITNLIFSNVNNHFNIFNRNLS